MEGKASEDPKTERVEAEEQLLKVPRRIENSDCPARERGV